MNISTLLPNYVDDNRPGISSLAVGILFSAYQLMTLIIAPILGDNLAKFGRRRSILIGVIVIPFATCLFALAALFENDDVFYAVSFFARCLQGAADALILVTVPSIIAVEWPEHNETYQGYAGISMGVGLMLGPVIATIIVRFLEYFWTLIFFAVLVFALAFTAACFIPKRIDKASEEHGEIENVSWKLFMKNPRVVMVLFVNLVASICLIFMDPILVL